MIKAVLFDLDGTIIDTERLYRIFWPMAAKEFGYEMSDEQALAVRSLGRPFAPEKFREWYGDDVDYFAIRDRRKALMDPYLEEHGVELKPGAVEILDWLKARGIIAAVVTASSIERTKKYLGNNGILDKFSNLISTTMVERGKPAPDVYEYACRELGLDPADCLAVEDSPNGAHSAYAAGCKVVVVPDQDEPDEELKKILFATAPSLDRLVELI